MRDRKWAVVQNLSPFGIRIESTHHFRVAAEFRAAPYMRYLEVMPLAEAKALDVRMQHAFDEKYGIKNHS